MSTNLVIVESPAKAKTIEKYLGKDFTVTSSMGHVRDLPDKKIGIDIEHGYIPDYEIMTDKKKIISELKSAVKKSDVVWLATDEDREGEAISWHLIETLNIPSSKTKRIAFHEITKNAILEAIANPRDLDINLVNAQQARRVLDRLVGYELSPVLWRKVKPSLSAGRVQSVAVRLIVEKEKEINAFQATSSYRVLASFYTAKDNKKAFTAELNTRFSTEKEAIEFLETCKKSEFHIADVSKNPAKKSPAPPFTTSTLQQEAARKLGFSVSKTMLVSQQLYEAGFEGLFLFCILYFLWTASVWIRIRPGFISGLFLVGYGLIRGVLENFREPDAQIGFLFARVTMGQMLTVPMLLAGLWIMIWAAKKS